MLGLLLLTAPAQAADPAPVTLPAAPGFEAEPNNTAADANPIASGSRMRGDVAPNGDVDFYKFDAQAGDKVYASVITSGSSSASVDSQLRVLDTDGTTLLEFDEDDGSLGGLSSSIAGTTLPAAGTYFLQVKHFSATNTLRPYDLYFQLRSGTPAAEIEPNDSAATATPLGSGFVSGTRDPALATEQDWYSVSLNAGDTIALSPRSRPRARQRAVERPARSRALRRYRQPDPRRRRRVGRVGRELRSPRRWSMTVGKTGTYYVFVDSATAATGGPTATYQLSANVIPAATPDCRSYAATPGALADASATEFDIPVADVARVGRLAVQLDINHPLMADLDVNLRSPSGDETALFNDIGATATGGQTHMELTLDEFAAIPPVFTVMRPLMLQSEFNYRMDNFVGTKGAGTWKLIVRDDLANGQSGTLNAAKLILCEQPDPEAGDTVFSAGFETDDDGFTHSGTLDEWERGTPATAGTTTTNPVAGLSTCATGTGCWKTDLDNTYDNNSNQDLLSPPISLVGRTGQIKVSWEQWHQLENATFDHATVSVEEDGGANPTELWAWRGATMTAGVGTPTTQVPLSTGWARHIADLSAYAGKTIRLRFHLDTDTSIVFSGMAIDDVRVFQTRRTAHGHQRRHRDRDRDLRSGRDRLRRDVHRAVRGGLLGHAHRRPQRQLRRCGLHRL